METSMKITKFFLEGFKPFLHVSNVHKIEAEIISNAFFIISQNGAGKSTLMGELTPLPANRPDYLKDGKKIIYITHKGIEYIITSDFSEQKGPYSFKKDGVELNESGTMQTQIDLVYSAFEKFIPKICNFELKICSMRATERKELLFSTYPTDLKFVLDYHKNISSVIRGLTSNVKMLTERKASLETNIMSEENKKQLIKTRDKYIEGSNYFDKLLLLTSQEIKECKQKLEKYSNEQIKPDEECVVIEKRIQELKTSTIYLINKFNINADLSDLDKSVSIEIQKRKSYNEAIVEKGKYVKERVDELENYINDDDIIDINSLRSEIKIKQDAFKNNIVLPEIQTMSKFDRDKLLEEINNMLKAIDSLSSCEYIQSTKTLSCLERIVREYSWAINSLMEKQASLEESIATLKRRYLQEKESSFPENCNMKCGLKQHKEKVLTTVNEEVNRRTLELNDILVQLNKINKVFPIIQARQQSCYIYRDNISKLETFFNTEHVRKLVLKDKPLIYLLKNNASLVHNNLVNLQHELEKQKLADVLQEQIKDMGDKIKTLEASKLPNKSTMSEQLLINKTNLEKLKQEYQASEIYIKKLSQKIQGISELKNILQELKELEKNLTEAYEYAKIKNRLDLHQILYDDCDNLKTKASEKLNEIQVTLNEQNNLSTRINDEVLPTLKEYSDKLVEYKLVEDALSPTTGLTHLYIVQYINILITNTNKYISSVWGHDLELVKVDPDKALDYRFRVKINKDSTIKDISICSKGQQEMVDLAWILALYQQMDMGEYPLKLDEVAGALSPGNQGRLLMLLGNMLRNRDIGQLFLIEHNSVLYSAFSDCQTLCLCGEDIILPANYNEHISIV